MVYDDDQNTIEVTRTDRGHVAGTWNYTIAALPGAGVTGRRLTKVESPTDMFVSEPATVEYAYYQTGPSAGLMRQITEPDDGYHPYEYYPNGRVFRVTESVDLVDPADPNDDLTTTQTFNYNLLRNLTEFTDERGHTETYRHQDNGLLLTQIHPDRTRRQFTWGQVGTAAEFLMQSSTDELGWTEDFYYAAPHQGTFYGELEESVGKDGLTTRYEYWHPATGSTRIHSQISKLMVDPDGDREQRR